ncbi:MAG TPA: hypothetical protein VGA36_09610, partial [Nitriliruptorales bacterium]
PLDVVGGAGLGFAVGAVFRLGVGTPTGRPEPSRVEAALRRIGLPLATLEAAQVPAHVSAPYRARLEDDSEVFVKLVAEEMPDRDLIYRAWRAVTRRRSKHEQRFRSPRSQVDHEAALALAAERAGVRTPQVLAARSLDGGTGMLAFRWLDGQSLEAAASVSRDDLVAFWQQVDTLHAAGIAHGGLAAANVILGADGPWLVDFGYAEMMADQLLLDEDVLEALISLGLRFGPDETLSSALDVLGPDRLDSALAHGHDGRLSPATTQELRNQPEILDQLAATRQRAAQRPEAS